MNNSILPRMIRSMPLALILVVVGLAGCKKHSDDDGHGHDSKPKETSGGHNDHDGHDHGAESSESSGGHDDHDGHDHGVSEEEHADEVKLGAEAVERYGIQVKTAQLWPLRPTVVTPARVAFNTEAMAHVGSPLRGRVTEVKVRLGDRVTVGQELLIIESPDLGEAQADLLQKRTAVQTAGPAVELAKVAWERGKALHDQSQGLSLTEVQKREAEYKAAVAASRAVEAAVVAAENRLHLLGMKQDQVDALVETGEINARFAIKAVIAGVVVEREATLGELVGPERESLLVLADTSTLWVLADVPEAKLAGLVVGNKAWVTLGSQTQTTGENSKPPMFEGQVSFIAPLVDPTTRTAQVRIDVPAETTGAATLKPGMFAQAEIVLNISDAEATPQLAVPDEAIQTVEGGPAIFVPVKGEPNTFAKRAVTISPAVGGLVPILSGLAEGEEYVHSGTFILKAELGKGSAAHEH